MHIRLIRIPSAGPPPFAAPYGDSSPLPRPESACIVKDPSLSGQFLVFASGQIPMAVSEQGCRPHPEDLAGLRVRYAGLRPAGTLREPGTRLPSALAESAQ